MTVSPCVIWYASSPAEILRGLVAVHEEELASIVPGPHNRERRAELGRVLEQYRRQLAEASARQPRQPS